MFFFLLPWKHTYLSYFQHLRFKNIPSEISHDATVIESFIFLLLSSFCPENSTLVQVFIKIGLIFTFLSTTPLIWDLELITISPTRIPFPVLGHIYPTSFTIYSFIYHRVLSCFTRFLHVHLISRYRSVFSVTSHIPPVPYAAF